MTATERPIIMSADSVQSILDGHKTQTRRVIKPQPRRTTAKGVFADMEWWTWQSDILQSPLALADNLVVHCPYGQPGDRLWVRETWQYYDWTEDGQPFIRYKSGGAAILRENVPDDWIDRLTDVWAELSDPANYNIDGRAADRSWRPSIFMPRWASCITLEIVDVRADRLWNMAYEDYQAEGYEVTDYEDDADAASGWFMSTWDNINGPRGFWCNNQNWWVWVVEFRRVE